MHGSTVAAERIDVWPAPPDRATERSPAANGRQAAQTLGVAGKGCTSDRHRLLELACKLGRDDRLAVPEPDTL